MQKKIKIGGAMSPTCHREDPLLVLHCVNLNIPVRSLVIAYLVYFTFSFLYLLECFQIQFSVIMILVPLPTPLSGKRLGVVVVVCF